MANLERWSTYRVYIGYCVRQKSGQLKRFTWCILCLIGKTRGPWTDESGQLRRINCKCVLSEGKVRLQVEWSNLASLLHLHCAPGWVWVVSAVRSSVCAYCSWHSLHVDYSGYHCPANNTPDRHSLQHPCCRNHSYLEKYKTRDVYKAFMDPGCPASSSPTKVVLTLIFGWAMNLPSVILILYI